MSLAFTRGMAPETPYLMAANLSRARRRPVQPGGKDWLRIAHRLAAGLSPRAAALPERADEALVERLLAREEFRAVVEGSVEEMALSPREYRAQLVGLARQTLERAMYLDDAPVALFILEEEARDRDPAATLADGVLEARARALRPPAGKPPERRPRNGHRDPLQAMMHRGTARLRHDIQAEDAIRRAAIRAAAPRTTSQAARHALALKQAAAHPVRPSRRGPALPADRPGRADPPAASEPSGPRRTRAP